MSAPNWDCHVHVIGARERYPFSPWAAYEPPDAPLEWLLAHLDRLGFERAVVVQPSIYGFDNTCLLQALAEAPDRLCGVSVPEARSSERDLEKMRRAGVRGIRCNLVDANGLSLEASRNWWPWMAEAGWHLQVQLDATKGVLDELLQARPPMPIVVDHFGFPPRGRLAEAAEALCRAMETGDVFVKLSAPYRVTWKPASYDDSLAAARRLFAAHPERCLWASDWPHTELLAPGEIDDAAWRKAVGKVSGDLGQLDRNADHLYRD